MASIRKTDTKPELTLRAALRSAGITGYRCHARALPGLPDVAFTRWRLAVFVDGVWWHGHPNWLPHGRRGPYWDAKIAGNVARDQRVDAELAAMGWQVLRVWDIDVIRDPDSAAARVADALARQRATWRQPS
jgi:DNA mismatch endonuclease (patch repair protein)